jgi:hypothetical protein
MKTSRVQLKAIIKEIMVEILSEGLGSMAPAASVSHSRITGEQRTRPRAAAFDPRLDTPLGSGRASASLKEAIKLESGGNPIMADIFADTARTTLPTQLANGDRMGAAPMGHTPHSPGAGQEQFSGDPNEVFGEASNHWADLAFMSAKKAA